jgi:hypothetical protein
MQFFKHLSVAARTLAVVTTLLVLIIVFWAGTTVGRKQAEFGYRWDKHYVEVFDSKASPFAMRTRASGRPGMNDRASLPNGAAGKIIAVNLPTIAVLDPNNTEKVILITADTSIRRAHSEGTSTDLHVGDIVTAIGSPDAEGRILATFIRIMPLMSTTTTSGQQR